MFNCFVFCLELIVGSWVYGFVFNVLFVCLIAGVFCLNVDCARRNGVAFVVTLAGGLTS